MLKARRGGTTIAPVLLAMVAIETFALRADTLGVVVIGVVAGVALVIVVSSADLGRVGVGSAYLCAFTISWNGWFVGPVRPGDVLILITLLCFAGSADATVFRSPPWWIKQLVFALVLGVVLIVLFPPDPQYLAQRVRLDAGGAVLPYQSGSISLDNIAIATKFIVAVAALPVGLTAAALVDRRAIRWLPIAFAVGTGLSGAAAFVDHTGIASVGKIITGLPNIADRQIGFATHPNFLAAGLVLAIPFACWMITSRVRWERGLGVLALASMLGGVYASGSRGGAVCAVGAVLLAFALLPRTRPHLPGILLGTATLAGIVAVLLPALGLAILRVTRLAGNPTTTGSDIVRSRVAHQGVTDFLDFPLHGIGLQASTDASQVYVQELAAGGLLLFTAMSVYMLGSGLAAWRLAPRNSLASAVLASIVATLALNIFEADLTDRFYYVPEAILVAIVIVRQLPSTPQADVPTGTRQPARNFAEEWA